MNNTFQKLTPTDKVDLLVYEDAFKYIFENDDIKNVAISGPYSAGKSSLLESYKKNCKDKKFLHISLAHFRVEPEKEKSIEENGEDKNIEAVLEGKILNQLIQQIDANNIPQTNFHVKRKVSAFKCFGAALLIVVFAVCFLATAKFATFSSWIEEFHNYNIYNFLKLDFLDGRMSIDQMMEEDGIEGEAFEDKNNEGPELKNEVMDINVQKLFDLFLDRMSDIEKFFALIEIGCSEKYASMTVSQFSVDPVFINIVEADSRYAKNIKMGDVVIKRPDRHSYTDRDIELKDVKFVGGTVVRYQREQTRFRWAKLKEVISEDDILGNKSVEYFQEKWDELLNKYNY